MSEGEDERSAGEGARRFAATVDQVEGDVVVLDVEGQRVKLPRALLPGAVREGAGYTLTIAPSPGAATALAHSVEDRLRALQSPNPPPPPRDLGTMPGAPPRDLGTMPAAPVPPPRKPRD